MVAQPHKEMATTNRTVRILENIDSFKPTYFLHVKKEGGTSWLAREITEPVYVNEYKGQEKQFFLQDANCIYPTTFISKSSVPNKSAPDYDF